MTVVACHQPNFLPWLGFWDKLARADVFVLLDSVQLPRTGAGSWANRVRILAHGQPAWATVPIVREGTQAISDVRIDDRQPWRRKLTRTIEQAYPRAEALGLVLELVDADTDRLAELNERAIRRLAAEMGLDTEIVRSSDLEAEGTATDLLISLVKAAGGDTYLSGDGADGYQEVERYAQAGLTLRFQEFTHPAYGDPEVPGLSIADAVLREGVEGAASLLR